MEPHEDGSTSQPVPCVREEDFVDVGTLTVVAPTRGSWTCVAGTTCLLDTRPGAATDAPLGHHLAVGDALYVMDTCGTFPASRFPRVDVVDPASAWSLAEVTAFGGQYRLCWCAALAGVMALNRRPIPSWVSSQGLVQ